MCGVRARLRRYLRREYLAHMRSFSTKLFHSSFFRDFQKAAVSKILCTGVKQVLRNQHDS